MIKNLEDEFRRLVTLCKVNDRYDCSEVAEDLKRIDGSGYIIKIKAKSSSNQIYIEEYGMVIPYVEHEIYVRDGWVYDPRYNSSPVPLDDYMNKVYEINGGKSNVWEEFL